MLAQHRDVQDAETDGAFTVKLYGREVRHDSGGEAEDVRVVLSPSSTDASFKPIVQKNLAEGELEIIAQMIEVLV